jgi:hypothetical protein
MQWLGEMQYYVLLPEPVLCDFGAASYNQVGYSIEMESQDDGQYMPGDIVLVFNSFLDS